MSEVTKKEFDDMDLTSKLDFLAGKVIGKAESKVEPKKDKKKK